MSEKIAKFRCFACKCENEIDCSKMDEEDKQIFCCGECGLANTASANDILDSINKNSWLQCIPFTGPEEGLPAGEINVGGVIFYITADGERLSREEFIKRKGVDPAIVWPKIRPKWNPVTVGTYGRKRIEPIRLGKKW